MAITIAAVEQEQSFVDKICAMSRQEMIHELMSFKLSDFTEEHLQSLPDGKLRHLLKDAHEVW